MHPPNILCTPPISQVPPPISYVPFPISYIPLQYSIISIYPLTYPFYPLPYPFTPSNILCTRVPLTCADSNSRSALLLEGVRNNKLPESKIVVDLHIFQKESTDSEQLLANMILDGFLEGVVDGIVSIFNIVQQIAR